MLELLRIRNLALIEDMELEFAPGLNVLSGETGAGKSFILKALGFLTGDRLETDLVRPGESKARAEAVFQLAENGAEHGSEKILQRELSAETGRSRLYINDSLGSQEAVKKLKPSLIIHTSQHGQQDLMRPAHQGAVLDAFLADPAVAPRKETLVRTLRSLDERIADFDDRCRALEERRELLEYQLSEIEKVDPQVNEEDALEKRKAELRHHHSAKEAVDEALGLLRSSESGVLDGLAGLSRTLETLARAMPDYAEDAEAVEDARQRLLELEAGLLKIDMHPGSGGAGGSLLDNLESIEQRLWELAQLARKLRRPLGEITTLRTEIEDNLSFLDSCTLDRNQLKKEREGVLTTLAAALADLNAARHEAAQNFQKKLALELGGLGFDKDVRVEVEFSPVEIAPGLNEDRPRFLWVPNPGQPPQPLDKIASGGELSRFLLALVSIMAQDHLPTLIFDEVDAGVGGITLGRVGERLKELSRRQQVVLISHWPQLAALADRHFLVQKHVRDGQTYTTCNELEGEEIRAELVRMAGGGSQGEAMARELLG